MMLPENRFALFGIMLWSLPCSGHDADLDRAAFATSFNRKSGASGAAFGVRHHAQTVGTRAQTDRRAAPPAFSGEAGTGSREKNAIRGESKARLDSM
jgi:hypothetical protein